MADIEKLPLLLENLEVQKEDALELFDGIIKYVSNPESVSSIDSVQWAKEVSAFLGCGHVDVQTKASEALAELFKIEATRTALSTNEVVAPLIRLLSSSLSEARSQACRAIGNLCFDNNDGRSVVFENNGLAEIVEVLRTSCFPESDLRLRTNAAGCLLNVIMNQEQMFPKVIEMGVMEILCDLLTFGVGTKQAEETAIHIYVILGLLTDSGSENFYVSERLCGVTVQILADSTNGELSELCVELLHSQADEKEDVKVHLAKAGLCELLIDLIEKHGRLADDDETRNLLQMACDLIVIILNGDESMEIVYNNGKGRVFDGLMEWLNSSDEDIQSTAILAIANFARTDKHCFQMVSNGVEGRLLALLNRNNSPDSNIGLQHALLGALRNLVIPAANKKVVLEQGLLQALYPMFAIPTFPVVFKLLGTLRIVIDNQPEAASELGSKEELIAKMVDWSKTDDHPGVQAEASRLLAWIIKNSRDRDVIGKIVNCEGIDSLVKMTQAEHLVMQSEAFLALNLTAAMRGQDAEPCFLKANIGEAIVKFLSTTPSREVFHNLLALVGQLVHSGELRKHLCEAGVPKALYSTILNDSLSDLREQVSRLASLVDPAG